MEKFEIITLKNSNVWDWTNDEDFWEAEIEMPDNYSLSDFHQFIQKTINLDNDHLYMFYAGRFETNKRIIFSEDSGYPNRGGEYDKVLLKDIYPLKGLKLYYLFDFGDNWIFEIQRSRKKGKYQEDMKYPRVISDNGVKLSQYPSWDEDE